MAGRTGGDRGADIAAYAKEMDNLRAKYSPLFAAQQQYKNALSEINNAAKVGAISEIERADAIARTKSSFADQVQTIKGVKEETENLTHSYSLNRMQTMELMHIGKSLADELAAGASPLRALTLEGGRIGEVFSMGSGGVGGTLKAIGTTIGGLISPTVAVGAVFAATAAISVTALERWKSAQDELAVSTSGLGRLTGIGLPGANAIAERSASDSGLSLRTTQSLTAQGLGAGLDADVVGALPSATKDFSNKLGVGFDDASKELTAALAEPARGAEDLAKKYGLVSLAQAHHIDELVKVGDKTGAASELMRDLRGSLDKIADRQSPFSKLLDRIETTAGNALSNYGRALSESKNPFTSSVNRLFGLGGQEQEQQHGSYGDVKDRLISSQATRIEAKAGTAGSDILGIVNSILPDAPHIEELRQKAELFRRALDTQEIGDALSKFGVSTGDAVHALSNLSYQTTHYQTSVQRIAENSDLAARQADAYTFGEKAAIAADAARVAVLRESGDLVKAAASAEAARNSLIAQGNDAADKNSRALDDQIAMTGLRPLQRALKEIDQKYSDLRDQYSPEKGDLAKYSGDIEPVEIYKHSNSAR